MKCACNFSSNGGKVHILYLLKYWFSPLKPIYLVLSDPYIYTPFSCLWRDLNVCGFGPFGRIWKKTERSKGRGVALLPLTHTHSIFCMASYFYFDSS